MRKNERKTLGCTTQSDKFKEAARELGVDLDEDQLRRTLGKLATVKESKDDVQDNPDEQTG